MGTFPLTLARMPVISKDGANNSSAALQDVFESRQEDGFTFLCSSQR